MSVRPRNSDHTLFYPSPDKAWYCRCLLFLTIVIRTNVIWSACIREALLSKLEPYCALYREADDWMREADTCSLYELAPTPRLFVRPITAILSKVLMSHDWCWKHGHYSVQHVRA